MLRRSQCLLSAAVVAVLAALTAAEPVPPPKRVVAPALPYRLVLRSRHAHVTPTTTSKKAQTGGGFIEITQPDAATISVLMRGSAAAGEEHFEPSMAAIQFELNQEFEVVAARTALRPPRLVLTGRVVGTLQTSTAHGGNAEQAPACVNVTSGGQKLVGLCVPHHGVAGGEDLSLNCREGPFEAVVLPGCFALHGVFGISASVPCKPKHCRAGAAIADFDPKPQLDATFGTALKPFKAVPREEFGFRAVLRVVEDTGAPLPVASGPPSVVLEP